jgi:hypothetical protein
MDVKAWPKSIGNGFWSKGYLIHISPYQPESVLGSGSWTSGGFRMKGGLKK